MTKLLIHKLSALAACAICALALTSCHTTEENYKASYDIAMQKSRQGIGEDTYNKIEAEKNQATDVINGDSVRIVNRYVGYIDVKREDTKLYSVILSEFKQRANARSMRDRLIAKGHNSYVLYYATDKLYYVAVEGFDTPEEAAAFIHDADKNVKMKVNLSKLWILKRLY